MRRDRPAFFYPRYRRCVVPLVFAMLGLMVASSARAAEEDPGWGPADEQPWNMMDYGPFLSHTITAPQPAGNVAVKGVAVRLGSKGGPRAAILFDTELCRVAAGWTGGFLHLNGVAFDGQPAVNPSIKGTQLFGTKVVPGWASPDARFDDPRPRLTNQSTSPAYGPLPADWAKYKGLYVHGNQVVFNYVVGGAVEVLELPGVEMIGESPVITRTLKFGGHDRELLLRVAEVVGTDLSVKLVGAPPDAAIEGRDMALFLRLPARKEPTLIKLFIGLGVKNEPAPGPLLDPETLIEGGPPRWPQTVETKGVLSSDDSSAYVVDTLTVPFINPYNAWMRFGGFDFLPDGTTAAVSTFSGDVWTCSNIGDTLDKLTWRRIATGLFQPLGLKVVDGKLFVLGRDQITRLHDLNDDGEIDFYENFNSEIAATPASHEFATDLQTDAEGNFYFAKAGGVKPGTPGLDPISPHHGCILRVSKDGSKLDVYATGLRTPNGISVGPQGTVTAGDRQESPTPAGRLNWITPGGFYGVGAFAHRATPPTQTDNPLCWLPPFLDSSSGGQVWVTSDTWGPFEGHLLHTSPGAASLFHVFHEDVAGDIQGGVVRFPLMFNSGIQRARFNSNDGQLYVAGMKDAQTAAAKDACLQRVRFTGKPVNMPASLSVRENGIEIIFTDPLNATMAADLKHYTVQQWNYDGSGNEPTSAPSAPAEPAKQSRDMAIKAVRVSDHGKAVFLEIPGLHPVMQMKIGINLTTADGKELRCEIYNTINRVGNQRLEVKERSVGVVNAGS